MPDVSARGGNASVIAATTTHLVARRFLTLETLRGVAAASVVVYHLRFWFPGVTLLNNAYLAVDFFFILSGFVIAYAYEHRLNAGMKFSAFVTIRAIRFYPMLIIASVLGFIAEALRSLVVPTNFDLVSVGSWLALGILCIPILPGAGRARQFFPLNWPEWSLFFELGVNGLYALLAKSLSSRLLILIILISGCAEAVTSYYFGFVTIGRNLAFLSGLPRATFPFFAGVLLWRFYRAGKLPRLPIPPFLIATLLLCSFMPTMQKGAWQVCYDLACIMVLYPAIIIAAVHQEPRAYFSLLARFFGEVSYPLYVLHFPLLVLLVYGWRALGREPADAGPVWIVGAFGLLIGLSYLVFKFYDQPTRRWLSLRLNLVSSGAVPSRAI